MIQIPIGKKISKTIPKEAFFRNLDIAPATKNKFVSDIKKLTLVQSISPLTCNLAAGEDVKEINIMEIELKKQEADLRILECIAKQTPFKLIFSLIYEGQEQIVVFHNKLFNTGWNIEGIFRIDFQGLNLNQMWTHIVSQVGEFEVTIEEELDEVIGQNEQIEKMKKQIAILENKIQREKQFNRQVELKDELKRLWAELEVSRQ